MAQSRRVVDAVRSQKPGRLLSYVVGLVCQATRSEVERQPGRVTLRDPLRNQAQRILPGDSGESFVSAMPDHRIWKTAELTQLSRRQPAQPAGIPKHLHIQRRSGVETKQVEANHA